MHLIRRSAFRAINSPSASFLSKPRSIASTSPFLLRSKSQTIALPIFRRFASYDVGAETEESATAETQSTPSSADSVDQSSIDSAISSATKSASTYTSDTAESLTENASAVKETIVDAASDATAAASAPTGYREETRPPFDNGDYRRSGPPRYDRGMETRAQRPALEVAPANSIYIGNLLFDVTEADLERDFAEHGLIKSVRLATDTKGLSKGFGYVEFDSIDAASAAIDARNQTVYHGRRLSVNYQLKTKRSYQFNAPSKTLFIGNLAYEMSDADLNKLFRDIRNVVDVRVAIDRRTGQPRGFAHAEFLDEESAMKGLEYLQGKEFYGRTLRVDYSGTSPPSRGWDKRSGNSGSSSDEGY